jgi:hypothetical protein
MEKNYKNNQTLPPLSKKTNFPAIILTNDENTKNNYLKSPKKKITTTTTQFQHKITSTI